MSKIRGSSNLHPCPDCGGTWFSVTRTDKSVWTVVCENCDTEYLKPFTLNEDEKQLKLDLIITDDNRVREHDP